MLLLGYGSAGWLLAVFHVPWLVWVGTLLMTFHLIRIGEDAIALSAAWVIGIMSIGAIVKAWTPVWNSQLPQSNAQLWAVGLMLLWIWALILVFLLGVAKTVLRRSGWTIVNGVHLLVSLVWTALGVGGLLAQMT